MVDKNAGGLVYPIHDSTESLIQRQIEGIQRMITLHPLTPGEKEKTTTGKEPAIEISLASKKHWELQIKTLRDAPRDPDELSHLLKDKQEEYEKAEDSEDIERLIPEVEMLNFYCFWSVGI